MIMIFDEKYDVLEHLKEERDAMVSNVKALDYYIENHKHSEPKYHIDKMEVERDYYADARDTLEIAINILTEKMG